MIKKVKDKAHVKKILDALKYNEGYCPCKVEKIPENRCMCKEFREAPEGTTCHCGLFIKEGVNNDYSR